MPDNIKTANLSSCSGRFALRTGDEESLDGRRCWWPIPRHVGNELQDYPLVPWMTGCTDAGGALVPGKRQCSRKLQYAMTHNGLKKAR